MEGNQLKHLLLSDSFGFTLSYRLYDDFKTHTRYRLYQLTFQRPSDSTYRCIKHILTTDFRRSDSTKCVSKKMSSYSSLS